MKIGIITWHNYPNFGSALQAFALHHFINENGGEAELINYVPGKQPALYRIRIFLSLFDKIIPRIISRKLHYRFLAFERKYFKETAIIRTMIGLKRMNSLFDCFICGSDQIWAPNVFNEVYMLSFVEDDKKKISYAASIGIPLIPEEIKVLYKSLLSRFQKISVREKQGRDLLFKEFGITSKVVLDPTLLIKAEDWRRLAKYPSTQKYLLCYFLGKNEEHRILVERIAQTKNLKIICLSRLSMDKRPTFITDDDAGPREFIGYIDSADIVVTDSFHGLCFSINLEKDFYVVRRFKENDVINQNSRILNILNMVGLEQRLIDDSDAILPPIDYQTVKGKLEKLRCDSASFLFDAINSN